VTNGQAPAQVAGTDADLVRELAERARAEGLRLTGEGGLLGRLTKLVVESALEGEMDDHLGYEKHDPAGRNGGNSRNGYRAKNVITEAGPAEISVPGDRGSSFGPRIVGQRRLTGIDDLVISLPVQERLGDLCGLDGQGAGCYARAGRATKDPGPQAGPRCGDVLRLHLLG
jgi:hypothetical protein